MVTSRKSTGHRLWKGLAVLTVAVVLGGGLVFLVHLRGEDKGKVLYRTVPVTRGDLVSVITATGTVEPEEVINVGAQVAGQILSFGKDVDGKTVDYGSMVQSGTVLARIDDSLYAAEAAQAEAQVQVSRAVVKKSEADLQQVKAKLRQTERDWERAKRLGPSEALSQASFDAYQSAYEMALAALDLGSAAVLQAKAGVAQAEASAKRAQRNLGYCTIRSPVKGVIIDRRVNIGQTVVASLNAPSLFLIAKDLRRMQVWVAVNEADVGKIRQGQAVTFTVDAFPGEGFKGEVGKIRLNASMTQNVVTYVVEVLTDNASGRLLPYLTANVQFLLERRSDVFLVPNAALRWQPSEQQVTPEVRGTFLKASEKKKRKEGAQPREQKEEEGAGKALLWTEDGNGFVRPLSVGVGMTDGMSTEIRAEHLSEGLRVVTGVQTKTPAQGTTAAPFTPNFMGKGGKKGL